MEAPVALNVLVVDDEVSIRRTLTYCLEDAGHRVVAASNARDALDAAAGHPFDLAFVDLRLGAESGLELLPRLRALAPDVKVVVITAFAAIDTAVESIRRGAFDYLPKPFTPAQVTLAAEKVAATRVLEERLRLLQEQLSEADPEGVLVKESPAMQRVLALARSVAASDATLLLGGESGTGKTLLARALHAWSPRARKPFMVVSCPSVSPELLEAELFGHVRGAFTGAVRDNPGRVALCDGGTLFLDEVGDLPAPIQPKLLRFIQERAYERVGDPHPRQADVRIVAATNRDLAAAVREGRFREDLYYRLNVIEITVPPLRERPEDVLPLARHLLARFGRQYHRRVLGFTPEAEAALQRHPWPGNVRELRNVMERAVILASGEAIGLELLPFGAPAGPAVLRAGDPVTLAALEEAHIRRVLLQSRSFEEAAATLGIDQATLWRRRKQYGI